MSEQVIPIGANGTSYTVTSVGRQRVNALTRSEAKQNAVGGHAYKFPILKIPAAAGDVFAVLQNASSDRLIVTEIMIFAAAAEDVSVSVGDTADITGGTTVEPAPMLAGSSVAASVKGVFEEGVDMTGLGTVTVLDHIETAVASRERIKYDPPIIIPNGQMLTLTAEVGTTAIRAVISFHFDMEPEVAA